MTKNSDSPAIAEQRLEEFARRVAQIRESLHKVVVGQDKTIDQLLICSLTCSHALLVGVPGLANRLARAAGAELGPLSSLDEGAANQGNRYGFDAEYGFAGMREASSVAEDAEDLAVSSAPGMVSLDVRVRATFRLR